MNAEFKTFLKYSTLFFVALALVIIVLVKLEPGWEITIFSEDGVIEDASAASYAIGAILGFLALSQGILHGRRWGDRVVLLTIPALSAVCFLDEISWGARIFHLQMPTLSGGGEFDGAHDVFVVLERILVMLGPAVRASIFIAAAALFIAATYWQRKSIGSYLQWFIGDAARRCLGAAILLLAFAVFMDFGHGRIISSLEEYSEMAASFYMMLAGFYCLSARSRAALKDGAIRIA